MSVRDVERFLREKSSKGKSAGAKHSGSTASSLTSVEERLRQFLGTKVRIRHTKAGSGEIVIEYYSSDDLDRLIDLFLDLEHRRR